MVEWLWRKCVKSGSGVSTKFRKPQEYVPQPNGKSRLPVDGRGDFSNRRAKGVTIHGVQCPKPLQTRLELPDFKIMRAIGHGCASTVFEAVHSDTGVQCVIKICMKTRLHPQQERRFRREVNIHSGLVHPNILKFYAAFEDSQAFYIVLEYARQGDLLHYIRKQFNGIMPFDVFRQDVLQPLLSTLSYLHSQSILHRDIKCENILVSASGHIKLCDFGFSISSYDERPKSYVGTLEYMAPELLLHKKDLFSEKLDIYAVGILTYECLVGVTPFYMATETGIARAILDGQYSIPSHLSKETVSFLKSTLQQDPTMRPSAEELLRHPILMGGGSLLECIFPKPLSESIGHEVGSVDSLESAHIISLDTNGASGKSTVSSSSSPTGQGSAAKLSLVEWNGVEEEGSSA